MRLAVWATVRKR